jgi:hypothetical protein
VETTKQISVSFENKPGRLANVLLALAREKVNLTAMSVMDSRDRSVLRFVTDDTAKSGQVLKDLGTPYTENDVLAIELRNHVGALAHVCELLASEHIHIDYAYCSAGGRNGKTVGIFKVTNTEKARRVLGEGPNNSKGRRTEKRPPRDRRAYQAP